MGKPCGTCGQTKEKDGFSANQWKKKDAERKCKACIDGGAPAAEAKAPQTKDAKKDAKAPEQKAEGGKDGKGHQFNFAPPAGGNAAPAPAASGGGFQFNFAPPKNGAPIPVASDKKFNFDAAPSKGKPVWDDKKGGKSKKSKDEDETLELNITGNDSRQDQSLRGVLQNNPEVLAAIQGQLDKLMGMQSGFVESLPPPVKRRIRALKKLQGEFREVEKKFEAELRELEAKYEKLYAPIFLKRRAVVTGEHEPKDDELAEESEDEAEEADDGEDADEKEYVGVPAFWLNALQNNPAFAERLTPADEEALNYCTDIRSENLPTNKGFTLTFEFAENPYFKNKTLTKSYYFREHDIDNLVFDHAEGCDINWKAGKNFTVKSKKRGGRGRGVEEPVECFFSFFTPPEVPDEEEAEGMDAEDAQELEMLLEMDYELGDEIKSKIVPRAVLWFTGEAAPRGMDFSDDSEGEEEDYDDDDDEPEAGERPAECNQQ